MRVALLPRDYVRVAGPEAAPFLERMLSNEVEALPVGESVEALLLTAKARVVARTRVWRRGEHDFLLLTEPGLGETLRGQLLRARLATKCEVELEEHLSTLVLGGTGGIANDDYGVPAVEVLDADVPGEPVPEAELERLRILARTPLMGRELDDRVLPAEAGLDRRAISFTKGCYPGQEPVARLHFRGHANRGLRTLEVEGAAPDAEVVYEGKVVGRVTSVADGVALAYVRREVPADAPLQVGDSTATQLH